MRTGVPFWSLTIIRELSIICSSIGENTLHAEALAIGYRVNGVGNCIYFTRRNLNIGK